ncbi:outer membrane protein assembly factor BamB [Alcanivorax sediminis]|uniref:Outer membrane protein assembly factor BamB n=1 Tax=Alcanivorax sediminis TaxID=2663008 RepID=A0A6N7LY98_9GAMM|nr:outer membrane protein assembly factor BamB [Alcanivorax sediminis]MQX53231.1 outer membrane protein assembly factor BamB [Alcanivorax sediminis]
MKNLLLPLLLAGFVLVSGCSSNPNAIEPNDLPKFKASYKVKRLWSEGVGDGLEESQLTLRPAVTTQLVVAGDVNGNVYAIQRDKGKRLWRVKTGDRIAGAFYAGYGMVLYGTREGMAVALDAETGETRWRTQLTGEALAIPTSDGSLAIFQTQDGHVTALDAETGEQRWDYETPPPTLTLRGLAQPVIAGDKVYAGFANAKVAALDLVSGSPIWEKRIAEPTGRSELDRLVDVDGSLVVEGGGVFAVSFQGKVGVLDKDTGRQYWDKAMSSATAISTSGAGSLFVADDVGVVRAIDQRGGTVLWQQDKLYGRRLTGTAYQDGLVAVGDFEGYIHWLNADDGSIVARKRHDRDGFAGTPVAYDDVLYVIGFDGKLSAYRLVPR